MIANFRKNKSKNTFSYFIFKIGAVLILLLALLLVFVDFKILQKKKQFNEQVESLQKKIMELENSNANLEESISNSDNDVHIEKVAREELDLQKPGEKVVSFIMPQNQNQNNNLETKNILQIWLRWLSGIFKK